MNQHSYNNLTNITKLQNSHYFFHLIYSICNRCCTRWTILKKLFSLSVLTLILAACTTLPSTFSQAPLNKNLSWPARKKQLSSLKRWHIQGAIAVKTPQQAFSAYLDWKQQKNHYTMTLFGPLGIDTVTITGKPHKITLQTAKHQIFTAESPENLIQQQLGWQLPVSDLYYWIRGIPAPGYYQIKKQDAYHHLISLEQNNWRIHYLAYMGINSLDLPSRIELFNNQFHLRIVIQHWLY